MSRKAIDIACPECGVSAGVRCVIAPGNRCVGAFHVERSRAAAQLTREENLQRQRKENA